MPKLSHNQRAKAFYSYCKDKGACKEGLQWIKGKTYKETWETLDNPCWLLWLVHRADDRHTLDIFSAASNAAEKANGGGHVGLGGMVERFEGGYVPNLRAHDQPKVCDAIRAILRVEIWGM